MANLCKSFQRWMDSDSWRWALGLIYIIAVATIWIAASYIVQSVVDAGVSPFLVTYICDSLFVIYIPIVEIARYFEDSVESVWFGYRNKNEKQLKQSGDLENVNLLQDVDLNIELNGSVSHDGKQIVSKTESTYQDLDNNEETAVAGPGLTVVTEDCDKQVDAKGRWTRSRVAKVSLLICPFWFFAQLTFNLSLKYTTVTSNTILSSSSSLFTFLISVAFVGEIFTWVKLVSVLLCMGGTIIVSLADSSTQPNAIATNSLLGDSLALVSAGLYAVYITLIRLKLPDEKNGEGQASTAQFLGFLGVFNLFIFFPVVILLNFTNPESFHKLNWEQFGLIVGKGLLDNVLSDYLWAKAIHLTTPTVATAGLSIQVPIAAVVDSMTGHSPKLLEYIGAAAVMVGFAGINIPADAFSRSQITEEVQVAEVVVALGHHQELAIDKGLTANS